MKLSKFITLFNMLKKFICVKIIFPSIYIFFVTFKKVKNKKIVCDAKNNPSDEKSLKDLIDKIDKTRNFDCYLTNSIKTKIKNIKYIKFIADAKFIIITNQNTILDNLPIRKETIIINLWHGCGAFKKFGCASFNTEWGNKRQKLSNSLYHFYSSIDIFTVSSPFVIPFYCEAINHSVEENIIRPIGIPRTDVFFDEVFISAARNNLEKIINYNKNKKVILYAPTFRGNNIDDAVIPNFLDLNEMHKNFHEEYILIIKHHPATKNKQEIPENLSNFAFDLTNICNINELIPCTDILISDYSSLIFEYSLFEKPMIFYGPDIDRYNEDRGFFIDYFSMIPGPLCRTNEELINCIKNIDSYDIAKIRSFKEKFMSSCDGHATERLIEIMENMQ